MGLLHLCAERNKWQLLDKFWYPRHPCFGRLSQTFNPIRIFLKYFPEPVQTRKSDCLPGINQIHKTHGNKIKTVGERDGSREDFIWSY